MNMRNFREHLIHSGSKIKQAIKESTTGQKSEKTIKEVEIEGSVGELDIPIFLRRREKK